MEKVILIADDDDNDVVLLKRVLKGARILNPVKVVANGEDAMGYLDGRGVYADRNEHPFPVLMFLNLQMPRKTGSEVLAWMQTARDLPKIKVVVMSGYPDHRPMQQAHHLGVESFLVKPPEENALLAVLKSLPELKLAESSEGRSLRWASLLWGLLAVRTVFEAGPNLRF